MKNLLAGCHEGPSGETTFPDALAGQPRPLGLETVYLVYTTNNNTEPGLATPAETQAPCY